MATNRLGIMCPACDRQGIVNSEMVKQMHAPGTGMMARCTSGGHTYTMERLMSLKPRMVKLAFTEKQPGNTIQQTFWIYPEALAALHERWPNNLMTTICSILTALADGSTFLVEGEYARELAEATPAITKGREVAGMLHTIRQQEERIRNLEDQVKSGKSSTVAPGQSAQLDAIMQALAAQGINVPVVGNSQQHLIPDADELTAEQLDQQLMEDDGLALPRQTADNIPAYRGLPKPVPGNMR